MSAPLRWNTPGLKWNTPGLKWNGVIADPSPPPPMSEDNQISASMTPANVAAFLAKLGEAAALLPVVPEISDAALRRLLGVDESTELDEIAAEALTAHPEWKPVTVDAAEYPKDGAFLAATAPLVTPVKALARKIVVMRRLAAHDQRRATLAIYGILGELAARGNIEAQEYYDRMERLLRPRRRQPHPTAPRPLNRGQ